MRAPERGEKIIETRLLIRDARGWVGAQYVWNDDATDARLAVAGEMVDVSWLDSNGQDQEHSFRVPNRTSACNVMNWTGR